MQCDAARHQIIDGLTGAPPEHAAAFEEHLATCAACRAERDALAGLWQALDDIDGFAATAADTARMRRRLDAIVDAYEASGVEPGSESTSSQDAGRSAPAVDSRWQTPRRSAHPSWRHHALQTAAAVAVFAVGLLVGRDSREPSASAELNTMRQDLRDLRQMVTLSLMQQQSASDRLKGVSWSGRIDTPSNDIVQALIDTVVRDPNVNVRLAGIDALERFADREVVRRAALDAVQTQRSPLVQIALIDFLVKVNERGSVPILKQIVDDTHAHEAVRARASWGLQILG